MKISKSWIERTVRYVYGEVRSRGIRAGNIIIRQVKEPKEPERIKGRGIPRDRDSRGRRKKEDKRIAKRILFFGAVGIWNVQRAHYLLATATQRHSWIPWWCVHLISIRECVHVPCRYKCVTFEELNWISVLTRCIRKIHERYSEWRSIRAFSYTRSCLIFCRDRYLLLRG